MNSNHWMSDTTTSIDGHELNQSLSPPANSSESTSLCFVSPSSSSGWVGGLQQACLLRRHSSWYTTFHWIHSYTFHYRLCPPICSCTWWRPWVSMVQLAPAKWQAPRAHVPSFPIHNQSVVHLEGQTCPPPSITTFANGLSASAISGSRRLGDRFQERRIPHVSVYFMPSSTQWGAFFLTVEGQKEAVPVVSSIVLPQDWIRLVDVRLSEYSQGEHLSSSIGLFYCVASWKCLHSHALRTALLRFLMQPYSSMSEGGTKTASKS